MIEMMFSEVNLVVFALEEELEKGGRRGKACGRRSLGVKH